MIYIIRSYEMDLRIVMYFNHFWVWVAIRTNIFYKLYKFLLYMKVACIYNDREFQSYDMLYKHIFHLAKY
jgi:hypothetical protein